MKISGMMDYIYAHVVTWASKRRGMQLKDRSFPIDTWFHYGNQRVAERDPRTMHDVEAHKINSSVYIATRAIADAVASLPVKIVGMETVGGVEREYEDVDHEANRIIENPNPTHSWLDIIRHQVKSYLGDGNAYLTIERVTGPNTIVEIWPRDPRSVKLTLSENGMPSGYIIGSGTTRSRTYKLNQVTHVRDIDPDKPFYGISRINSVRVEIMMDYFANTFNSKFFEHGAALHLMFTPNHDLSDDQHEQLLEAMSADIGGVDQAFKTFINKYAGKFTNAELKHKDIAFIELLHNNREKIFGVYGLPPFRGGVMEYSNYANALMQDLDFWNNTIVPILAVFEATFNKQLIWPIYGTEFRLKFDLSDVPALRGDPLDRAEEYCKYVDSGIMLPNEVREKLDLPPLPKDAAKPEPVDDKPDDDDEPTPDEEQEATRIIHSVLREQYTKVAIVVKALTVDGRLMSMLYDPRSQSKDCFSVCKAINDMQRTCLPLIKTAIVNRVLADFQAKNVTKIFDIDANSDVRSFLSMAPVRLAAFNNQTLLSLQSAMGDADRYGWTLYRLLKEIRKLFTHTQAESLAGALLNDAVKASNVVIFSEKHKESV